MTDFICPKCKADFDYEIRDVNEYTEGESHLLEIDCPICKQEITVVFSWELDIRISVETLPDLIKRLEWFLSTLESFSYKAEKFETNCRQRQINEVRSELEAAKEALETNC